MEIYIKKLDPRSPMSEEQISHLLETNDISPEDLACAGGMQEWKPLYQIPEAPCLAMELFRFEVFLKIVDMNFTTWQMYEDNLLLRKEFEKSVDDLEEEITSLDNENKFENHPLKIKSKVCLYYYQALLKIKSNAFMTLPTDDNPINGAIMLSQNQNAAEAVMLLDKAIELSDNPRFHLMQFVPLLYLNKFEEAADEIDYVLENFADNEEVCNEALRLSEMLESTD